MTTLTNSYSFSFNGLTFGGASSPHQILSVDGLEGLPEIRNQDDNRGYNDGMFSGQDFLGGRTISIIINTFGSGGNSAQQNLNALQQALMYQQTGTQPLYFLLPPNTTQFINARVRGFRSSIDPNYTYGYIVSQIDFFCPDPKYYDNTLQTATLQISAPPGREYNRTYNLTYGFGSLTTLTNITNSGWVTTYPQIVINGPATNIIIGNTTTNNLLYFTGLTLAPSDIMNIDLYNKLITINGLPARNVLTSGTWFAAPVGTSQYYLFATNVGSGTTATVTWRNAYA